MDFAKLESLRSLNKTGCGLFMIEAEQCCRSPVGSQLDTSVDARRRAGAVSFSTAGERWQDKGASPLANPEGKRVDLVQGEEGEAGVRPADLQPRIHPSFHAVSCYSDAHQSRRRWTCK